MAGAGATGADTTGADTTGSGPARPAATAAGALRGRILRNTGAGGIGTEDDAVRFRPCTEPA